MQPLSMARTHLSKRFLESLKVSSVFTFGQEQRKTRSHLVHSIANRGLLQLHKTDAGGN